MRATLVLVTLALSGIAHADRAITADLDLREAPRRLLRAELVIPVAPGKQLLRYAKWIPGTHSPMGDTAQLSELVLTANGKPLAWTRDPIDLNVLAIDVPAGTTEVRARVEYVMPETESRGDGARGTEAMTILSWEKLLWYPDAKSTDDVRVRASVRLPAGWKYGTALPTAKQGDRVDFTEASLTTVVDSPLLAGKYTKEIVLADKPRTRVFIAADSEEALEVPEDVVATWKKLVAEAQALFGVRHYSAYTFLLSLSDRIDAHGLEHHESSDNGYNERVFLDDDSKHEVLGLFAHEYVHSWNGKFRRARGLTPGRFDQPMNGESLWVYEGLTEYLGMVLAARSGPRAPIEQYFAKFAVAMTASKARTWRPLVDTAIAAQGLYGGSGWRSRTRGVDFYPEGALFWLEVDTQLRSLTKGEKSIDDFCRAFYAGKDGEVAFSPYDLDDVYAALDKLAHFDWKALAQKRVYTTQTRAPYDGLTAAGYQVVWTAVKPDITKAEELVDKELDHRWTLGIVLDEDGEVQDVVDGSPADRAGMMPKQKVIAVNGRAFTKERLEDAIKATPKRSTVDLIVSHEDVFSTPQLVYKAGLRYPHLTPIKGVPDLLSKILAPKTK